MLVRGAIEMVARRPGNSVSKFHVHILLVLSFSFAGQSPGSQTSPRIEVQPSDPFGKTLSDLEMVNMDALRRAVCDLAKSFPNKYTGSGDYLSCIDGIETDLTKIRSAILRRDTRALKTAADVIAFQREVLLSNPLLNFDRLLLIKRKPLGDPRRSHEPVRGIGKFVGMPQQSSWQLHTMKNTDGWDNEICVLSPLRTGGRLTTVYRPSKGRLVSEMDLHFDAERVMFSMPDESKLWQVYEVDVDDGNQRRLSPGDQIDVHNFDSCYLPNDKIAFVSTAPFQGVPCNASVNVGMTYLMDADGTNVRQLCFEQDHNFCPTVMNDGRILYLRWEYTDIPHVWARFLFTMNPDGTGQREYYGSGGYWPNAIFFARPVPDHPTKVVGIVTGHHVGRVGELVVFDPALGRNAADGVVQRIPGFGKKVESLIEDKLAMESWPKFLHPWPLSEKYFLVACKPRPQDLWGIYLVDVFDNILLLKELEGYALLEPIPLRKTNRPPLITDRIDLSRKDALVYLENVYEGPGLKGVPHEAVKQLRLFTYHFAYHRVAGINHRVGADGPWEPKRVLGTVPVEPDGSAMFRIPANTPISIQPIDADGKALQLMRSWMTAMPGEIVSCVGCHEKQNAGPPNQKTIAALRPPSEIEPWYGPSRGFSFRREVQPVLDRYCVSCHDGANRDGEPQIPDLRADQSRYIAYRNGDSRARIIEGTPREDLLKRYGGVFDPSYITLRSFVRVGGLESDLRLLSPGEFCADTTELVQMLMKGHHGVKLDAEAWQRFFTWIDLNAPAHGTWREVVGIEKTRRDHRRRLDLRRLYGGSVEDPEVYPTMAQAQIVPIRPKPASYSEVSIPRLSDWPFSSAEARRRQKSAGPVRKVISLDDKLELELVRVPAGTFVMGDKDGDHDEQPLSIVEIARPFWMSKFEITNAMYLLFDPSHDSKYEHKGSWMFNEWDLGWDLNGPDQPVVRVSLQEATAFCRWLAEITGLKVSLPTEAQWEWACRAGTDSPLNYGDLDTDFSAVANMADFTMHELVYDARNQFSPDLIPRDARFDDEELVATNVGNYLPNRWGLHDMHGNVWEWTRSLYQPYPYYSGDGRNDATDFGRKVVRGGSWYDRPKRCRSAFRLSYPAWRKAYNVGFRIVVESSEMAPKFAKGE
jgi:formylglycine-generating enzyme required for sulfatase activity/cytochrome c553